MLAPLWMASAQAATPPPGTNTVLILYDGSSEFGWVGELNSTLLGNLLGHFPLPWRKMPVENYQARDLAGHRLVFYLGTEFDNALPEAFLEDVRATTKTVCWMKYNLWQLQGDTNSLPAFEAKYGFRFQFMDAGGFTNVAYKGETFSRHPDEIELGRTTIVNDALASAPATASRREGSNVVEVIPYVVRGSNLWYVGDVPFTYISEEDRYLAFADLLHDIVGIDHPENHRAIIRLEDVDPVYPTELLRAAADYLHSQRIPFAMAVVPVYADPLGYYNDGQPERVEMARAPHFVEALRYMIGRGGQLVMHGYTHQYDDALNPFTGVTGDDYEFFRVTYDAQTNLVDFMPLPEDSRQWAQGRIRAGLHQFEQARLTPVAWETPHYGASALDYLVFAETFPLTIQRALYFDAAGHVAGQFFPYVIERDVYGQKIMPENLGNVDPEQWSLYPPRLPQDLIRAARKNRVVRDGWASGFFHPYLDLTYLMEVVEGVKALGYTYVPLSDTVAPTILADPAGTNTLIGETVAFRVEAVGTEPLRYQWLRNGWVIAGATNQTLTLTEVRPDDAAVYTVGVTNAFGSTTSAAAQLIVSVPAMEISLDNSVVTLSFPTVTGVVYILESKNSLASDWATLRTLAGTGDTAVVTGSVATNNAMRLYRLRAQ